MQINDLHIDLEEELDLSKSINLDLKVSKLGKKYVVDLCKDKKNLNLKPKYNIKLEKNHTKNFDGLDYVYKEKIIDLNTEKKNDFFKRKIATTKFKIKNLEFLKQKKDIDDYLNKEIFLEEQEQKEQNFVNNFIEQNTKNGFEVYPLYKTNKKINLFKVFFVLAIILFIGLFDRIVVEYLVRSAYSNLIQIKNDYSDFKKVEKLGNSAGNKLLAAKILFFPFSIIPNETIQNVNYLINGGKEISNFSGDFIDIYSKVSADLKDLKTENIDFSMLLIKYKDDFNKVFDSMEKVYLEYDQVTQLGDGSLNEKLDSIKDKINTFLVFGDKINKNFDIILDILGNKKDKKYLIILQNNDEIRATGGFMGSVALLDISAGKIKNLDKKDIYALEWQINQVYKNKEKAPEGLNKITTTFGLRDANYFPEIKESSEKIKFFLDKIDLEIDGIVYLNQNLILDLIDSIGGIYSKTFNTDITSANFSILVSTLVEAEVFREGTLGSPKEALFLFSEELFERLLSEKKYYDYLNIISNHIKTRDLIFYSFNPEENSFLWKMGLNGQINYGLTTDFNYPIYTSIGGNKSDRFINYRYEKIVKQSKDSCDFDITLKIFNTHTFSSENEQYVTQILDKYNTFGKKFEDILNIQGKGTNKSYLRVILPKEANISLGKNQKLQELDNYKILEFYTETKAGQSSNYDIIYTIKNPDCEKYSYKFYKQAGIKNYQILFNVLGKETSYTNIKTDFIYKD